MVFDKLVLFNPNSYFKSVETSDEFQEIREVIDRYETLTTNCKDLVEIQKENEDKFNMQRRFLNTYLEVLLIYPK